MVYDSFEDIAVLNGIRVTEDYIIKKSNKKYNSVELSSIIYMQSLHMLAISYSIVLIFAFVIVRFFLIMEELKEEPLKKLCIEE